MGLLSINRLIQQLLVEGKSSLKIRLNLPIVLLRHLMPLQEGDFSNSMQCCFYYCRCLPPSPLRWNGLWIFNNRLFLLP